MHSHGSKRALPSLVLPSVLASVSSKSEKPDIVGHIPYNLLHSLPEHAQTTAVTCGITLTDCLGITVTELQELLSISEAEAKSFLLRARRPSEILLKQVVQDSQKARSQQQVAVPPAPLRRSWLQLSVKPGAIPLELLAVQPAKGKSTDERRASLLMIVFGVAVALGKTSLRYSSAIDCPEPSEAVRNSWLGQFKSLNTDTLSKRVATLKRWAIYRAAYLSSEVQLLAPDVASLIAFLAYVAKKGPAAASECFKLLNWWRSVVGVPFLLSDPAIIAWSKRDSEYVAKQQVPIAIFIFVRILQLASSAAGTIRRFAMWTLLPLFACLRFKHVQISSELRVENGFLRGRCKQGKRRIKGTRPAFEWSCCLGLNIDKPIMQELILLQEEYAQRLQRPPDFVIPDVVLDSHGKMLASSQLLMRPMAIGKFVKTLQKLCESCGATEVEAKQYTTYSLRRFLPTVAGNLKIPESMAEAVGDWQQATSNRPLPPAMATHYNNDRVAVAGDIKTRLLMAVAQLVRRNKSAEVTWDSLRNSFTWDDLCRWKVPTFAGVAATVSSSASSRDVPEADSQAESTESDSCSTSDSEFDMEPISLEWFQQTRNGKVHVLQKLEGSALIPWCRSTAFSSHHEERGSGVELGCNWCTSCIQRAPIAVTRCIQARDIVQS